MNSDIRTYELPKPLMYIQCDLNYAINARRSVRRFDSHKITKQQISNLLWASQGITDRKNGFRAAPSAGATYPFNTFIIITGLEDIPDALYKYDCSHHSITLLKKGDMRKNVRTVCFNQNFVQTAPVIIILAADYKRTSGRYGSRAERYVHIEAGHIGQNIYLESEGNGLATVAVGAFNDAELKKVLGIDDEPLYVFPIGKKA